VAEVSASFNLRNNTAEGDGNYNTTVSVTVDPTDSTQVPILKDADGDTLATWDPSTRNTNGSLGAWIPEDSAQEMPNSGGINISQWLRTNHSSLRRETNDVINENFTATQAIAFNNAGSFTPFDAFLNGENQLQNDINTAVAAVEDIEVEIDSVGVRGLDARLPPYQHYYYPRDLESNKQDRIKFTMKSFGSKRIATDRVFQQEFSQRQYRRINGSATLPINPNIQSRNGVGWQGGKLNAVDSRMAGISLALMEQRSWEGAGSLLGGIMGQVGKELGNQNDDLTEALKVYLAQQAVGAQGLLSRTTGAIVNPNLELLLQAPELRSFDFTFLLSPRDRAEADQARKIIRFFKQGMSVKSSASNVFLKAPNVFDIRYQTYDDEGVLIGDHPSINRIKTSALTNCQVDYTPDGSYMTYSDEWRTMTQYRLRLSFTELHPVYEDDYNNANNRDGGEDGTWQRQLTTNEIGY